jgi:hypothetical protein
MIARRRLAAAGEVVRSFNRDVHGSWEPIMSKRSTLLVVATLTLLLGVSALTSHTMALIRPAAPSPLGHGGGPPLHFAQVRAEYIDLDGNGDETNTTCTFVNTSMSKTLYLGDVYALGPDGLGETLAVDTGLNGVGIPPLGSVDLPVDAAHFPGLQPKIHRDSRGVESVLVGWSGSNDELWLTAAIHLEQPGNNDNRVVNRVEGRTVSK